MDFILNKTFGINNIENVCLEKIIDTFSKTKHIEITVEKPNILDICLKYEAINLNVYYIVNFDDKKSVIKHRVHFVIRKLYLNKTDFIEEGDEIGKILPKIKKYLVSNKKNMNYIIERKNRRGIYYFDNYGIAIFYQKEFNKKVVEKIDVSLPCENIFNVSGIDKILGIEFLKEIL